MTYHTGTILLNNPIDYEDHTVPNTEELPSVRREDDELDEVSPTEYEKYNRPKIEKPKKREIT